jgi:tripartite-type tricarboxylate transporter receptor subunit TctC
MFPTLKHAKKRLTRGERVRALTVVAFICPVLVTSAASAAYPERPIRFVVPYGAGGPGDTVARVVGTGLSKRLGQPVVIDIRPGASTIIGTEIVARAPGDGYSILTISTTHAVNPALYKKLPYDPLRDFAPVTLMAATPFMLCVNPKLSANSVRDLVTLAKAKPGSLAYGSGGTGSSLHLTAELFGSRAGIRMLHVPYKGAGPAFIDLISGQVQVVFSSTVSSLPHMKSGRVRVLAVTSLKRTPAAPDVPTLAESGFPGFESSSWFGVLAPASTPPAIVLKLQQEIAEILKAPEVGDVLAGLGADPGGMPSQDFGKYFRVEIEKWGKVVRDAKIVAE